MGTTVKIMGLGIPELFAMGGFRRKRFLRRKTCCFNKDRLWYNKEKRDQLAKHEWQKWETELDHQVPFAKEQPLQPWSKRRLTKCP